MSDKNCVDIPESFWKTPDMLAIARYCKIYGVAFSAFQDKFFCNPKLYHAVKIHGLDSALPKLFLNTVLGVDIKTALLLGNSSLKTRAEYDKYLAQL